jgi:hypothetical protein
MHALEEQGEDLFPAVVAQLGDDDGLRRRGALRFNGRQKSGRRGAG